ncbi:MAG: hypothetical protein FGM41_03260 [Bacteroidetes bacterium]|nr:hypothetical protein [Bacteroidota bacterium]
MQIAGLEAILADLDIKRYPTFYKYFHETLNYEKRKFLNYNFLNRESLLNNDNRLKLYLSKNVVDTVFHLNTDIQQYEVNYQFDRLLYFEFSENVFLDDYMENYLKRKSYFIVKYDSISGQEIELRLSLIQKFLLSIIRDNPFPIGVIFNSIISNNLIPNIRLKRHHKTLLLNELKPLIYWGFLISKES